MDLGQPRLSRHPPHPPTWVQSRHRKRQCIAAFDYGIWPFRDTASGKPCDGILFGIILFVDTHEGYRLESYYSSAGIVLGFVGELHNAMAIR